MRLLLLISLLVGYSLSHADETKVLSYNIWFNDNSGLSHRYQQINDFIESQSPDYLCLQEVTKNALQILKTRFGGSYQIYDEGTPDKHYGNVILTKSANSRAHTLPLQSKMQRNALIVEDTNTTVVNLHLESMLNDTQIREQQLAQIIVHTQQAPQLILCGDFNFGDRERENNLLTGFSDAGREGGLPSFDVNTNALAAKTRFYNEPSRRLDKILTRGVGGVLKQELLPLSFSDHYPVVLTISK